MYLSESLGRPPRHPKMRRAKRGFRVHRFVVPHEFPHEPTRVELDDYYYDDQQLGGLGKKLKKLVKKVAAPIAHIGAAVLTGGASLAASAAIIKAQQERKAAAQRTQAEQQIAREQIASQERMAAGIVAPPAAPTGLTPSIAPPAGLVQQVMPVPTMIPTAANYGPASQPQYEPLPPAGDGTPKWVMPAAAAGAGLLAILLLRKQ